MAFADAWQERIWPAIEDDFVALVAERPCKVEDGAVGQHYGGKKVSEALLRSREMRNVTCNLAWVKVLQMAPTNQNLSLAMVEKGAQTLWHQDGKPRLPQLWPRQLNIPIACLTTDEPVKGEMVRYGCCLAVCSFWLTYFQAKTSGDADTLRAMRALAANVPFDFKLFNNQDEILSAAAESLEANEMLRELFGLSGVVLINLVQEVKEMLGRRDAGKKDANAIAEHLATLKWYDAKRCPKKDTVEHYLTIGGMLRRAPRAQVALEMASARFGRDTVFDEPTKLLLFVQKSANAAELEFLMEGLLVGMIRSNNMDRQSVQELKNRAGEPAALLFIRRYFLHLERQYPLPAAPATGGQMCGPEGVRRILFSPLAWWHECLEGPAQGLSWTAGLSEPWALMFAHGRAVLEGRFNEPLRGPLGSPPPGGAKPADFLKIERVKAVFLDPFEKAYREFTGKAVEDPTGQPGTGGAPGTLPGTGSAPGTLPGTGSAPGSSKPDANTIREDARRHADEFLAQHLMIVVKGQTGPEMLVALRGNAGWAGLTNARQFSGIYDPKNARLAKIYAGSGNKSRQNWWQRVPALVVADFQTWARVMDALMTPGIDMVWVFSGKSRSQERLLEAEMAKLKWEFKPLTLVYDPRTMRNMYWVRERGMGNAGMTEVLYCCWKGAVPKFPSNRAHVDAGAPIYYDVMQRVPVASEGELLWGTPADRDRLLAIMGVDIPEAADTAAEPDPGSGPDEGADTAAAKRKYAKRHSGRALVRTPSSDQVPLFPLDNSPRLTKEIVHESGSEPRVILHGTPAGGAGVYGLLSMRAYVVALVQDDAHGAKMRASLLDRIADSAMTPGGVFRTPALARQVQELGVGKAQAQAKQKKVVSEEASGSNGESGSDSGGESDSDGGDIPPSAPARKPTTGSGEKPPKRTKPAEADKARKNEKKPVPSERREKKDPRQLVKKDRHEKKERKEERPPVKKDKRASK